MPYISGEQVNRENFWGFLICGFAISHASITAQERYIEWVQEKTKVEIFPLIQEFKKLGGWSVRTPQEQQLFMENFGKVKKHHVSNAAVDFWEDPKEGLDIQLRGIIIDLTEGEKERTKKTFEDKYGQMGDMSESDLISNLQQEYFKNNTHIIHQ